MLKGQGLKELSPSPENLFHLEMACASEFLWIMHVAALS